MGSGGVLEPGVRQTGGVSSSRKVLQVLLSFSEDRPHATIQEVAEEVGVPVSTAYRYISLLRELTLLEEGDNATYHVAPRIMAVARAAAAANTLGQVARPVMEALAEQVDETILLVRVIQDSAVLVDRIESRRAVRLSYQPGYPLSLHSGASGKTLLSFLPVSEREAYLQRRVSADPAFGKRLPALREELAAIAERGWAVSHGEIDEGIWALSVAVRAGQRVPATLTVAGPEYRIPPAKQEHFASLLTSAAADLGERLRSHDFHP